MIYNVLLSFGIMISSYGDARNWRREKVINSIIAIIGHKYMIVSGEKEVGKKTDDRIQRSLVRTIFFSRKLQIVYFLRLSGRIR
jgi:hypothetical protein